jgi:hypothetical protein
MLDYWKIWVDDPGQIDIVLNNSNIRFDQTFNEDGELIGINGKYKCWSIKTLSPNRIEIAGSIHKYWNRGTNENDFPFRAVFKAIDMFCQDFQIDPTLAYIKNLEFGVNLQLNINASEIIDQIISFNNQQPLRPYDVNPEYYFIEFAQTEYFLKVYDKGKQFNKVIPSIPNTLRIELKAIKNRFLPNVLTLADLQRKEALNDLGVKFVKLVTGKLILDDDTINLNQLTSRERKLYIELRNPRNWRVLKGKGSSSTRAKIKRFKNIIEKYGKRKIYSLLFESIWTKICRLNDVDELTQFTSNTYTVKY